MTGQLRLEGEREGNDMQQRASASRTEPLYVDARCTRCASQVPQIPFLQRMVSIRGVNPK